MKNLLNVLWRDRGSFYKALVTSELISMIAGLIWTALENEADLATTPEPYHYPLCDFDNHMGQHIAILVAVRWLIVSTFLSTIASLTFSRKSDNNQALLGGTPTTRCRNASSIGFYAILSLGVMLVEYAIFHKIIGVVFNPDPSKYPSGIIDCFKSLGFRFATDAVINASGTAAYLTGLTFFHCTKDRNEERQQLVNANFPSASAGYGSAI